MRLDCYSGGEYFWHIKKRAYHRVNDDFQKYIPYEMWDMVRRTVEMIRERNPTFPLTYFDTCIVNFFAQEGGLG